MSCSHPTILWCYQCGSKVCGECYADIEYTDIPFDMFAMYVCADCQRKTESDE